MAKERAELVFIPIPGMGHLPSMVELARRLVSRYPDQISITVLIMTLPYPDNKISFFIKSLKSSTDNGNISYINLPPPECSNSTGTDSKGFLTVYMESYKPIIKQTLLHPRRPLGGIIVDMFCTAMIDVANDLDTPAYIYFASGAALLRLMLHFESTGGVPDVTRGEYSTTQLNKMSTEMAVEVDGFKNPVPLKVWPDILLDKDGGGAELFLGNARRFRESKGVLVNTFTELEPDLLRSLAKNYPVFPVGPILNLKDDAVNDTEQKKSILGWLDLQPTSSVVFLCFGSRGTFDEAQLKEIAAGLEECGYRFLWSLRQNPLSSGGSGGALESPAEYENLTAVLPESFLERTEGKGRVIGWAPQASVLGHKAVGAFVSHCGWNSLLEAVWFGVPVVTWPMYFEQQLNAFMMVKEMEMAVEITIDYRYDFGTGKESRLVKREEIVAGIRKVMEEGREVRGKVKENSELAKVCLEIGGSSFQELDRFVKDVFRNM